MGTKKKQKSTRSVTSSNSKGSSQTRRASNVSSPTAIGGIFSKSRNKRGGKPKLPPSSEGTPEPLRERAQSEPVDLDDLADALRRGHHNDDDALSPAETFDTVPLSASPSRSFGSRSGIGGRGRAPKNHRDSEGDSLPVSRLRFDSPIREDDGGGRKGRAIQQDASKTRSLRKGEFRSRSLFCGGGSAMYLCLVKPVLLVLLLVALVSGSASVYGWLFRFPALNQQIEVLEEQVHRLSGEVDRLETENDRYAVLNNRLNITVDDLEDVADDLNGTVSDLEDVAEALNTTRDQIIAEVQELRLQNLEYSDLNEDLREQVSVLDRDLETFRASLAELSTEHAVLRNTTDALQDLAVRFSNTTVDQNETLAVLRQTLEGFRAENDRLEGFNRELEAGLDYLNQTLLSNGLQIETSAVALTEITRVLGEQVQQQQRSTLTQLEISYRQILAGWDCDYRDVFRSRDFGQDFDAPILGTATTTEGTVVLPPDVRTYLEERVMSGMCLDGDAFSRYLFALTIDEGRIVTSNELVRAVVLYTEDALRYYFPFSQQGGAEGEDGGDEGGIPAETAPDGIDLSEWIDAGFRCDRLEAPFAGTSPQAAVVTPTTDPIDVRRVRGLLRQRRR
mmetsp:Transcript_9925/g.24154  ORF Transcript_9925/g.24154 Transcript_9925/m.24154 type:complete len:620 (-) Transcript_9925:155-2014(-)